MANRTTKKPPGPAGGTDRPVPAWRRVTEGEHRWTAALAVVAMIALQSRVPEHLVLVSWWLLPALEAILLLALIAANPGRLGSSSHALHRLSLALIAVASLATGWAAASLVAGLVRGTEGQDAKSLLFTGGNIWVTNIVVFALWYWDLDRGGPGARARNEQDEPDFLFSQMTAPELAPRDWEPRFHDYLYLAYTNATAFSPTDTMPLSTRAKLLMSVQSVTALMTSLLVVARAVSVLH